jgi:NAD+ kinase
MIDNLRIGCLYNKDSKKSYTAFKELSSHYDLIDVSTDNNKCDIDFVVTLGGDGEMLRALHMFKDTKTHIYGMNRGSLGFLLNKYTTDNLLERIKSAVVVKLHPLKMIVSTNKNETIEAHAFNEISLLRETNQTAKIRIIIDDVVRLKALYGDGILVSTPAGSTAYNFAARGLIMPLTANILGLTPISPFRPRRWDGALITQKSKIRFEILEFTKRAVSAVADSKEVRDIQSVEVYQDFGIEKNILFDKNNALEERVFKEQFFKG